MGKRWKPNYLRIAIFLIGLLVIVIASVLFISKANTEKEVSTVEIDELIVQDNNEFNFENIFLDEQTNENVLPVENTNELPKAKTNTVKNQTTSIPVTKEIPYYIKVNYKQNVVTIYEKDEKGDYTVPIKAMLCSTGTATPQSGIYTISQKYEWGSLIGGVYAQYATRIINSILFHSVPYLKMYDKGSLEYWEYDKLGASASAGCVRLTVADAKWIYNNCIAGTKVEFYADDNPGPLGKPSINTISSEIEVRDWDPTDPAPNNPWKYYYKGKEENIVNEITNNVVEVTNSIENNIIIQNIINETRYKSNEITNNIE